jgi:hypothetical protein
MAATGGGKTVGLLAEETENGARVRLTGLEGLGEVPVATFPGVREKVLLEALRAQLAVDIEAGQLVLALPRDMD